MALVDMIVLGLCVVLAVRGAFKGFTWQLVRTLGLVGAIWLAGLLSDGVGAWIHARFDAWVPNRAEDVVAWIAVFLLAWLVVTFVAYMAKGAVRSANLSVPDRLLGFVLGAAMGVVLATVGFVVYGHFARQDLEETLDRSVSARFMARLIDMALPLVPEPVRTEWADSFDEIRRAGDDDDGDAE